MDINTIVLLAILLVLLIIGILILFSFRDKGSQENQVVDVDLRRTDNPEVTFSFWLFSKKNIDELFHFLAPTKEIVVKDSTTFFGEGSIDLKILPTSIKSSYQQTIEKQTLLPTPVFKYEFSLRKLRSENKLTIIDPSTNDSEELIYFNELLEEISKYEKLKIVEESISQQREELKLQKSIEALLVDRAKKIGAINCFFRNYKFTITKKGDKFSLISKKEDNKTIDIVVIINEKTLTEGGVEHFNSHVNIKQGFTIFGKGTYFEDQNQNEGISITPFVIF